MWTGLAVIASFLFPGTGQALSGRRRRTLVWVVIGVVPILLAVWLPQLIAYATPLRLVAAVDAGIVVHRAKLRGNHGTLAGLCVGGQLALLGVLRLFVIQGFMPQSVSMAPTLTIGDHVFANKLAPRFTGHARGDVVVFDHPILGVQFVKRIAGVGGDEVAIRDGVLYVNGTAARQTRIGETSYWDMVEPGMWIEKRVVLYREVLGGHDHAIYRDGRMPSEARLLDFPFLVREPPAADPCADAGPDHLDAYPHARPANAPPMRLSRDGQACVVPPGTYFMLGDNRDNSSDSRSWGVVPEANLIARVVGIWWAGNDKTGIDWSRLGRID